MPNFAVTTTQSENKSYSAVAAALEAILEATDNAKVIRHYSIVHRAPSDTFVGTVVVDT